LRSSIDTNILSAIWTDQPGTEIADSLLDRARARGGLLICGIVYAELLAHPKVNVDFIERFFESSGIEVDCAMDKAVWHEAGIRYRKHSERRRRAKQGPHRRLIADFVIGAHALLRADRLITFNGIDFRRDFPELAVVPE
jgi:predicted nucleic acid-binding protein